MQLIFIVNSYQIQSNYWVLHVRFSRFKPKEINLLSLRDQIIFPPKLQTLAITSKSKFLG